MEYEGIGEEVSVESAVVQAAHTLDLAGKMATDARNTEALLDAARRWQDLADFIFALGKEQEKKGDDKLPMGFQRAPKEEEIEDEDARSDDGETTQSEGQARLQGQHGKLREP